MKVKIFGISLAQRTSKGQGATEYMLLAAVVLAASGIIFFYTWNYSHNSLSVSKCTEATETIAAAIDYVYSLGYGTQTTVDIELPGNVISGSVGNKEVMFVISTSAGNSDIVAHTKADASGTLPIKSGRHNIIVNYTETGVVVS